jgi:hypothetical protein
MIKRYSQYSQTLTDPTGVKYLSGLPFLEFLYSGRVQFHKVRQGEVGRLDIIAYAFFGDPTYWYPIAIFNNLFDPMSIDYGDELAIPIDLPAGADFVPFTYEDS